MSSFRDSFRKGELLKNSSGRFGDGFRLLIEANDSAARSLGAGSYVNIGALYQDFVRECEAQVAEQGGSMHELEELYYPERFQRTSASERLDSELKRLFDYIEYRQLEPGSVEYLRTMSRVKAVWRQKYEAMTLRMLDNLLRDDGDLTDDQIEILQEVIEAKEALGKRLPQYRPSQASGRRTYVLSDEMEPMERKTTRTS